jgi:tRNA threonylcarbamoyladenosine biosynthesis protein TsaE
VDAFSLTGRAVRYLIHSMNAGQTLEAGERLGRRMASEFPSGIVALLVGPLGAGKTVMAKGIARGLGVLDPVISPTYTIIQEYRGAAGTLHHVDLYRIEGRDQMENLGLEDILSGSSFVLVEWGEKLEPTLHMPTPHLRVTLSMSSTTTREILIEEVSE